jgi:hypothetical protein
MKTISRSTLINLTIFIEGFLLLVATGWSHFVSLPLLPVFAFNYKAMLIGAGAGVLMALSAYLIYLLSRKFKLLRQLRESVEDVLIPMVSELTPFDCLIIAILSGFCEEVFFRGVAQQQLGVVVSSLAFGLFHDPSFRNVSYAILACLYGFVLALLFTFTGSLWTPIFAHAIHNLISLLVLRYFPKPPATPADVS